MISETIHVSHADILQLDGHAYVSDLKDAFREAAEKATAIEILGGYVSVDSTIALLKTVPRSRRAACQIRVAIGLDASAKLKQNWADLRRLHDALRKAGFKKVTASVITGRRHFHTKLFHFLRTTHHVWFVGSANPGSDRHELMVSFTGRHKALKEYIDAAFAVGHEVTKPFPPRQLPKDLREFFLTGSLIHRISRQSPFTFDAFRLDPEDRAKIMRALTAAVVPHARPTTQGFAFGLRSAVETVDILDEDGDDIGRVQVRLNSVDTVLGLWAPRPFIEDIKAQLAASEESRVVELQRFAEKLSGDGAKRARAAFSDYLTSMERLLADNGIKPKPVAQRDAAFERFLASRQRMLADETAIARLARRLEIMDMPDIWYDPSAVEAFETGFFSEVAYRLPGPGRIIKSIARGLSLPEQAYLDGKTLREQLERRLERQAWRDAEWAA
ncbi:phospholipase D family protein [Neorhizobium sp. BT27B]|uniref:phospholipase D family protein n=1 Tax=Neorhizobium sp. BT27B TaxID=3142625 RepID=UPI003D2E3368